MAKVTEPAPAAEMQVVEQPQVVERVVVEEVPKRLGTGPVLGIVGGAVVAACLIFGGGVLLGAHLPGQASIQIERPGNLPMSPDGGSQFGN